MSSTPETPHGPDLDALREEIDELAQQPVEDLISPVPETTREEEPDPKPTEAIGSVDWNEPYDQA